MASRRFIPCVEQLERRLMLSVVHGAMPATDSMQMLTMAAVEMPMDQVAEDGPLSYSIVIQDEDSGHVLTVTFDDLNGPRLIGIAGGDSAWTQPDGTVRFNVPDGARELELTITNDQGAAVPFVRIELDSKGHIVHQTALIDESHDSMHTLGM